MLTLPATMLGDRLGTFGWAGVVTPFPRTEDWKIADILRSLGTRPARVVVVSDHIFINWTTLQFYACKDHLPLEVTPCWELRHGAGPFDFSRFDIVIAKSDVDWIKRKSEGCFNGPNGREEYGTVIRRLQDRRAGFILISSVGLADGSSLLVFGANPRDTPPLATLIREGA